MADQSAQAADLRFYQHVHSTTYPCTRMTLERNHSPKEHVKYASSTEGLSNSPIAQAARRQGQRVATRAPISNTVHVNSALDTSWKQGPMPHIFA